MPALPHQEARLPRRIRVSKVTGGGRAQELQPVGQQLLKRGARVPRQASEGGEVPLVVDVG
jgi:hypothetical protein